MPWDRRYLSAFGPLVIAHLALLLTFELAARVTVTVVVVIAASVALWVAARRLRRVPLAAASVIIGAAILRILLLPLPPTLSDDLMRYVWDGRVAGAGLNPYELPPEAGELEPLRDDLWVRLPHKDVATVYPPLALSLFVVAARAPQPALVLKILFCVADLLTCWLLILLADRRRVPRSRVILYAWNPLVALEVAGMGHVDALGVLAVVATVLLLMSRSRRPLAAAIAAAAAVLAKVIPILAWPAWARRSSHPVVFLGVGAGILIMAWLPVVLATGGVPSGYIRFGVSWEFNGPLYEPLWRLLERMDSRSLVEGALDLAKEATGKHALWNRLYPFNYPQFLAKLLLAIVSLPFFFRAWRRRDPARATGAVFMVLIMFSSTVYPWYLLWVLPWVALDRQRAWFLLAALLPLSYIPQFLDVDLFPAVFFAIWAPFFVLLALERRWFAD
jgi:alpha-1,6-mannosyltransferase